MNKEIEYKGFTIYHVSKPDNGTKVYRIYNDAGLIKGVSTLKEAKGWIDNNPIDNYTVYVAFGDELCDAIDEGFSAVKEAIRDGVTCDLLMKSFKSKAEKNAYAQGIDDMCGWLSYTTIDRNEYKRIKKLL